MRFVAVDLETANPNMASVCQIGLVRFEDGVETAAVVRLIDPQDYFAPVNVGIHGIEQRHIEGAPTFAASHDWLSSWTADETVVCHTHFDRVALAQACQADGLSNLACQWLDTAKVARRTWAQFAARGYGLANVAAHCGITFQHHDALHDARTAGLILLRAKDEIGHDLAGWIRRVRQAIDPSKLVVQRTGDGDGALTGETIVFTGALEIPRRVAADRVAAAGADVQAGVNKATTLLVVGDQDIVKLNGRDKSGKHIKAETMRAAGAAIRIIGETDFMALAAITE